MLAACSWTAVLLVINRALFRNRLIETGDQATILFQVYDAEHFHELLGNYSRWMFHHPGPAFMYLLALGDATFRRCLHISPEPFNAAFLTLLLTNAALLFFSIRVFARHCKSAFFLPCAMLLSLGIIYVINRTYGPVATTDLWIPYALLFVFLLFIVLCASVADGKITDLPLLVVCGGLLVHGHVAQTLFVGILPGCALLTFYFTSLRTKPIGEFLRANRLTIFFSSLLLVVFLAPMFLDVLLDQPNNVQKIRTYLVEHRHDRNRLLTALRYEGSFFTFTADPENRISGPGSAHMFCDAAARPYVLNYWAMAALLACSAVFARRRATAAVPFFLVYIGFEILLVSALFLYWARRITGPLYSFNGHFFYAIQFLALFTLAALTLDGFALETDLRTSTAIACALPLLMFASPAQFNRVGTNLVAASDPWFEHAAEDSQRITGNLPRRDFWIRVRTPDGEDGLLRRTGIASRLHWAGQRVCLDDRWVFLLEDRNRCEHVEGLLDLELKPALQQDAPWSATLRPFPAESLPFTIGPEGRNSLMVNSFAPENFPGGVIWTRKQSRMRFLLSDQWNGIQEVEIEVRGMAIKARPVMVLLNEQEIGRISGDGSVSSEFVVKSGLFRAGHENEIAFKAADSPPVDRDTKNLAFDVESVRFQAMPVEPAGRDHTVSHNKAAAIPFTR